MSIIGVTMILWMPSIYFTSEYSILAFDWATCLYSIAMLLDGIATTTRYISYFFFLIHVKERFRQLNNLIKYFSIITIILSSLMLISLSIRSRLRSRKDAPTRELKLNLYADHSDYGSFVKSLGILHDRLGDVIELINKCYSFTVIPVGLC